MTSTLPPPAVIEVLSDHGGTLGERMVLLDYLKRNGIAVRIVGVCGSACEFFSDATEGSGLRIPAGLDRQPRSQ
jgi:hypothetical protein